MFILDSSQTILFKELLEKVFSSHYLQENKVIGPGSTAKEYALEESNLLVQGLLKEKETMLEDLNSKTN